MTFQFNQDQIDAIQAALNDGPNEDGNYSRLYQTILDAISDPDDPDQPLSTLTADEKKELRGHSS